MLLKKTLVAAVLLAAACARTEAPDPPGNDTAGASVPTVADTSATVSTTTSASDTSATITPGTESAAPTATATIAPDHDPAAPSTQPGVPSPTTTR